jgi:hypothetical protein
MLAAAALAESHDVPAWVAGFIYGMTGDNHLDEIENCFTGSETLYENAKLAFSELSSGNISAGAKEAYAVFKEFPQALSTCENLGDDLDAIAKWAEIFEHPETLAKTVSKNYLLHKKQVDKDLAQESADYAAYNDFACGIDSAGIATILVGEIEPPTMANYGNFTAMAIPDYLAGLVFGLTGDNQLEEFEKCFSSSGDLEKMGA